MAIFQPSYVVPDVRNGLGLGVVDATQDMTVSWRINGPSALTKFQIQILTNNAASTQLLTTGAITTGCPAYGTTNTGAVQLFSYTISAATLATAGISNGNEYKIVITQWWSSSESVTQNSASVFVTRAAPTLSIASIGTVTTRYKTFTGNYAQANGDVLNWFRWRIAYADSTDEPFYDTGNVSGTMDISCTYDGFFGGSSYAVRLNAQTENGVEVDTGWVSFSVSYTSLATDGEVTAGCVGGTDAVLVEWSGIGYIPGTASGDYSISKKYILTLPTGSTVTWDQAGTGAMSFANPWSVAWHGTLGLEDATIFTIEQESGDVTLSYDYANRSLVLAKGGTTLVSQSGVINGPNIWALLTPTNLYLRVVYMGGGLYPAHSLYPAASLYPQGDTTKITNQYTLSPTYTQETITSVQIGGYQVCNYIEVINGAASAKSITQTLNGSYRPGVNDADYMMADWTQVLDAGTLNINGDAIQGFALYRRQEISGEMVKVAETGNKVSSVYDYGALSQSGPYTYYLFPIGTQTYISQPLTSGTVMPCWWNWTLMEAEETDDSALFTVVRAFRFRFNVETGAMGNNNTPSVLANFTPYPKIQLSPQNYRSATLSGLIGVVDYSDGQPKYADTIEVRDALYALSVTQNPLFLKNRKGDLFRVKISGAISVQTEDNTIEQTQTATIPWVEVGPASGIGLASTVFAGAQEEEGEYVPQYYMDTSDATADADDIRIAKIAYTASGRTVGEAMVKVSGNTLVLPEEMAR